MQVIWCTVSTTPDWVTESNNV